MSEQTDTLLSLLEPYGLTTEASIVYLDLLANNPSSALTISRRTTLPRTKVYRILDTLLALEMVVQSYDERGFKFIASSPEKLQQLVADRESAVDSLKKNLPNVVEELHRISGYAQSGSKVLYYSGQKGLDRVNFNTLRARGELLSFEIETANAFLEADRAEYLRRRIVEEKIHIRTITNARHLQAFTKVTQLVTSFWNIRHIPKDDFPITLETFVYNDVYLIYHYTDNDVFCVEFYNQHLVDMQRKLFEYLWQRSMLMNKIGNEGEASIDKA